MVPLSRRKLIHLSGLSMLPSLAGCSSGTPDGETLTEASGKVTTELTIQNRDQQAHSGSVQIAHVQSPECSYRSSPCGEPSKRTVALDAAFDLDAGEKRTYQSVSMSIDLDDQYVDSYSAKVTLDSRKETLWGLEEGAESVVEQNEVNEHPWRVATKMYQIHAIINSDGIEISVQAD